MVLNVGPSPDDFDETVHALKYGAVAKEHVIWDRSARRASLSLTNTRPFLMFNQSCAAIGVVCAAVGGVVAVIHVVEV
jgi:hypothetical protein